jgi:hypothetical protein
MSLLKVVKNFFKKISKEFIMMSWPWKSIIILLIIGFLGSMFLGGCTSLPQAYIQTNHDNCILLLPDFENYINKDKNLTETDKNVRIKTLKEWLNLNKEMLSYVKEK